MLPSVVETAGSQILLAERCGSTDPRVRSFTITNNVEAGLILLADAMYDFAKAQEVWYSTWPEDPKKRGMAMYV